MSEQAEDGAVPDWDRADRMRKALRHSGLGVQEMADYLGASRTSASNWLNGRVRPSMQTLRLWALRTGVSYAWLVTGDPATTKESVLRLHMKSRYVVWALAS